MPKSVKAIVNTLIPEESVTDFEILMLEEFGFECEKRSNHYRFFAEDRMEQRVEEYKNISSLDIEYALKDPKNKSYFNSRQEINDHTFFVIFQNIIKRSRTIPLIEIEGIAIRKKLEPGSFSGFAYVISKNKVVVKGTGEFLREAREEIEHPTNLARLRSSEKNNDYIMAVDGSSVRIHVGDICLYVVPTVTDLTVLAYTNSQKLDDPIDALHVTQENDLSYGGHRM